MRIHWAASAFACALIATLPANLAAQTAPASNAAPTAAELAPWGLYARLAGQTMKDAINPSGYRLHWHWETPGQVLVEEWYGYTADPEKPAFVMTLRLGPQPGTLTLKSSTMMGKEWVGTLQGDGSISFVGKGLLKLPYSIRVDEQGDFVQSTKSHTYRYAAVTSPAASVAEASPAAPAPVVATAPQPPAPVTPTAPVPVPAVATAPASSDKPAPVVAKQEALPPAPPLKRPRKLSDGDLARLRLSVQKSRARSIEQARVAELQRQEAARQAALQAQLWAAQEARRQAEEAEADAEFEAERARKAAAWQQSAQANEQALADATRRLNETTARVQAQQADALARQRAQSDALAAAERRRQMELIRQANQRQEEEAARLAAQRQQYEQQRADAAERARLQQQNGAQESAAAGRASTDTDANRCVTQSEVRQNDTFQGNTAAYVVNGCGTPVDVKICLMTDSGWKCGATWGLASQAKWSYSAFHATGAVFVDAKTAGSSKRLGLPN